MEAAKTKITRMKTDDRNEMKNLGQPQGTEWEGYFNRPFIYTIKLESKVNSHDMTNENITVSQVFNLNTW